MQRQLVRALSLLGWCALALVILNIVLFSGNRALRDEVNARQKFINDSIKVNQLNNQLIQLLARTAVSNNDLQLQGLLATNGVTYEVRSNAAGAASPSTGPETPGD
jgi:hypothetical protein